MLDTPPSAPEEKVSTPYPPLLHMEASFLRSGRWKGIEGTRNVGADGLGEVVAVGDAVEELKVGDYVTCVFCASFSEYTTPTASNCFKVPSLDPAYAALRVAGTFSCSIMNCLLDVTSDQSILVTAACGGVGHILVQMAKLKGCHVIGTCGGSVKKQKVMELGVDRVIDYTTEVLKTEYPNGVDYVVDGVGGAMMRIGFNALVPGGKLVIIGYFSEYPHNEARKADIGIPGLPSVPDLFWNGRDIIIDDKHIIANTWPSVRSLFHSQQEAHVHQDPSTIDACRQHAFELFEEGKLQTVIDDYAFQTFIGIERAVDAINYMLKGRNVGKVLLRI